MRNPDDKANSLARTIFNKFTLLDLVINEFSFNGSTIGYRGVNIGPQIQCVKNFRNMDIYSGAGPDFLASRVLVECFQGFSLPLAKFIRRMIALVFLPRPRQPSPTCSDALRQCIRRLTGTLS